MKADEFFKNARIRKTPVRTALLNILTASSKPVSVPELEHNETLTQLGTDPVTIYRTLETFYDAGIVKRVEFQEGKFRYELSSGKHHHHVVCTSCGKVVDVADCLDKKTEEEVAKETGFTIASHSLEFFGLCSTCRTA